MGIFKNIFTWWEGASFGTWFGTRMRGRQMGTDALGNSYYEGGTDHFGRARRWVMFKGSNDTSRIPPEWHSWLVGTIAEVPDEALPAARQWQQDPTPNLTGTAAAYKPAGAMERGAHRAAATGDYEAWSPDAA